MKSAFALIALALSHAAYVHASTDVEDTSAPPSDQTYDDQPAAEEGNSYQPTKPAEEDSYQPPAPTNKPSYGHKKKKCTSKACPGSVAAVLYEQDEWAGYKHWVDAFGKDNCRGLNGTAVQAIRVLTAAGLDDVEGMATPEYAAGVQLTFYDDWSCKGSKLGSYAGHQKNLIADNLMPKSVKLTCNGKGSSDNASVPLSERYTIKYYVEKDYHGQSSQQDAHHYQCRGLDDQADLASVQFLKSDTSSEEASAEVGRQTKLVFYSGFGCTGQKVAQVVGKNPCVSGQGNCAVKAGSVKFMPAEAGDAKLAYEAQNTSGAATFAAGAISTVAAVFALLI